ncbi:MAG: bifunctional sugar-1-phosphate nucleotidylyltransferase/acetyltransferase [Candidatus Asgardarchaeia archaeon]
MKAVVLAAGKGKRLRPFTYTRPKPMMPVGGKPILEHTLTSLSKLGIRDVIIVVNYMKEKIIDYFGDGRDFNLRIKYVEQEEAKGTGDAILRVEEYMNSSEFLVVYGDVITHEENFKDFMDFHKEYGPSISIASIRVPDASRYAVIMTNGLRVTRLIEKPPPEEIQTNLINAGIYILPDEIFDVLKEIPVSERGELELPDAIQKMIDSNEDVMTFIMREWWLDIGRPWDLLSANQLILSKMQTKILGEVEEGATIKGPVYIGKNTIVRRGTYILGPTYIGEDSDVGPNNYIRPFTTIGNKCRFGHACEIKNSIIFDNTHVAHLSYVGDSVIGENVNFGAGTITANLRLDEKTIKMYVNDKRVDTNRRKLGAFIGDNVKTGIHVMFMPGVKVGPNSAVAPGLCIYEDIPPETLVVPVKPKLSFRKWIPEGIKKE